MPEINRTNKYSIKFYESVYIEREVEAADEEEAWEIVEEMALPSVAEAWAAGEVETDVFGWEAYDLEEIGKEQTAA